jgi:hypothetical protein
MASYGANRARRSAYALDSLTHAVSQNDPRNARFARPYAQEGTQQSQE